MKTRYGNLHLCMLAPSGQYYFGVARVARVASWTTTIIGGPLHYLLGGQCGRAVHTVAALRWDP